MQKGFISFIIVFLLITLILITIDNYYYSSQSKVTETIKLEKNYYHLQDMKHAFIHSTRVGVRTGVLVWSAKTGVCIISALAGAPCTEMPEPEEEIKQTVQMFWQAHLTQLQTVNGYSNTFGCGTNTNVLYGDCIDNLQIINLQLPNNNYEMDMKMGNMNGEFTIYSTNDDDGEILTGIIPKGTELDVIPVEIPTTQSEINILTNEINNIETETGLELW